MTYEPTEIALREEFASSDAMVQGARVAVVGHLRGSGNGRSLLLFGHPDAEDPSNPPPGAGPESWSREPFETSVSQGRMYGWGIADDLMGVAAGVCAIEAVTRRATALGGDVFMASTPSKFHARGATAVLQRVDFGSRGLDAAVYLHPAESGAGLEEIKALSCGQLLFRLEVLIADC